MDPQHVRDRVSVDIRIQDARPVAQTRERRGEVGCERRLPHTALTARDRNDARPRVDRASRRPFGDAAAEPGREGRFLLGRHDAERERDGVDPLDGAKRLLHLILEARPERTARNRERDLDRGVSVFQLDTTKHLELDDRASELRVNHLLERTEHLFTRRGHVLYPSNAQSLEKPAWQQVWGRCGDEHPGRRTTDRRSGGHTS
jgi:hypothetical protein